MGEHDMARDLEVLGVYQMEIDLEVISDDYLDQKELLLV